MGALHELAGWVTVVVSGIVGLWGVILAWRGADARRPFWVGVVLAVAMTVFQVLSGLYLVVGEGVEAGDQHVFYGLVIAFVLAFAYIYRPAMGRRPAFAYGLMLLFVMGLSLRAISTFGLDF